MSPQAIAIAMSGRDLRVCAQTGSGKTLAFMLPVFWKLLKDGPGPTRNRCAAHAPRAAIGNMHTTCIYAYNVRVYACMRAHAGHVSVHA